MPRDSVAVIAIVDDDEAVRAATASLVRSLGYSARTFASGRAFLDSCDGSCPDCLITDVQMPEMTGIELQQALIDAGLRFPVIVMTAFPTDAVRDRVMAAGAFCFLAKPSDGDTIIRCIEDALAA